MNLARLTGTLLIILPLGFNVTFYLLQKTFEYPDILRKPTGYIVQRFQEGGSALVLRWYAFMFFALLFVPASVLTALVVAPDNPPLAALCIAAGLLAALVQVLGLIRWPFVVPYLAKTYLDSGSSQSTRDAIEVAFQAFHRYAGVAIGEHLGYLFTSAWTVLVALAMLQPPLGRSWLGWIGLLPALGILVGVFEESGFNAAGAINAISYILWSLWLMVVGVILLVA